MRETGSLAFLGMALCLHAGLPSCVPTETEPHGSAGGSFGGSIGSEPGAGGRADGPAGGRVGAGGAVSTGGRLLGGQGGEPPGSGGSPAELAPRWLAIPVTGGDTRPLVLARSDGSVPPITVAENISSFSSPSWSGDGASLIYVDYFCCGFSNAAYEVSVAGLNVSDPVPIHAPLTGGETVRYAAYSPQGDILLAGFVDAEFSVRYALRHRGASASEWLSVQGPEHPWSPGGLAPAWAPHGNAVLLIGGDSASGERLYRVSLTDDLGQATEVLALPAGNHFTGLVWSPDSERFAAASSGGIHLGDVRGAEMVLVSGDGELGTELGQGGAEGDGSSEFGPHFPFQFSDNSRDLVYGAYSAGPASGTMRLFSVALPEAGLAGDLTKAALLEAPKGSEIRFWGPAVLRERQLFLPAAILGSSSAEIYQIDLDSSSIETRAPIPEGQSYQGFSWVPAGIVYVTADSSYLPNRLLFESHGTSGETPLTLFQFDDGSVPAWSGFLGMPSRDEGGFFFANELDPDSGYPAGGRLWHYDGDGELRLISDLSESACAFTDPGAFDPAGEQFALSCDLDGDQFSNLLITTKLDGEFGEPIDVGSLFDVYGGTPGEFVWQP